VVSRDIRVRGALIDLSGAPLTINAPQRARTSSERTANNRITAGIVTKTFF
jgi:hypothetical protein